MGLPPILPELPELPRITDYNQRVEALWQIIKAHNQHIRQLPATVDQRVEQLLARIWSGINLDEIAFTKGHITYRHLQNIDGNANPHFYTELSNTVNNVYKPPCQEDFDSPREEEGKEENPLRIPDPSRTHLRILQSGTNLEEQTSENMSNRLERHLGTIIEETFWERTTPEL